MSSQAFVANDDESLRLCERLRALTDSDEPWTLRLTAPSPLGTALWKAGVVPEECRTVTIGFEPDDVMTITYKVFVKKTDIPKIHRALDATGA